MNRTTILLCLAACMMLSAGCHTRKTGSPKALSIAFEPATTLDLGQFIEGVRYVQLENHPESAFTDIDKLITGGSNLFLLDKRLEAVFCFDTTGRFRYRIQRIGKGPGEYQELDAIWIKEDEQELCLQSFWPSKIMVYDFNGNMLREFDIRWSARDMIGIGKDLIAGYNTSRSNDGADSLQEGIFLLNKDGKSKGMAKTLGNSSIYWSTAYQRNFEEYGSSALLLTQSDTIFKIDPSGKVTPDICLNWGKLKCPAELKDMSFNSPGFSEAFRSRYVIGKDQLLAFGPVRMFRIFLENHMEMAMADLNTGKGYFSTQITSGPARIPLLNAFAKSDNDELIGIYDMSLLLAMNESKGLPPGMDTLVGTALRQDRPVLWFAKIKQEWQTQLN